MLSAILHRLHLPLSEVSQPSEVQIIPIPRKALDMIVLEDQDKESCAQGGLGQAQGFRAVGLSEPELPENQMPQKLPDTSSTN